MNKRIKKKVQRRRNKELCKRYPFLIPRNHWTDEILWENKHSWYYCHPYSHTELDCGFPDGWFKAFGKELLEELREECIKWNYLDKLRIVQIKEKYGELRIYIGFVPKDSKFWDIIDKYTNISQCTCIRCGRPATKISLGWISPYCTSCANNLSKGKYPRKFRDINEQPLTF